MILRPLTLEEHQQILYEILYVFDDFCREYNIRYFLDAGTLLGAIRNNGIIPWDDDIDVAMMRSEYERFQKIITANPPKGFIAYSIQSTRSYYYPFIKFGKLGTLLTETDWKCTPKNMTINIDVFPIDACPNDYSQACLFTKKVFQNNLSSIKYWTEKRFPQVTTFMGIMRFIKYSIPFFKRKMLIGIFSKSQTYSIEKTDYVSCSSWAWHGEKNVVNKHVFDDIKYVRFGEREFPAPIGYHEYLSSFYGNYMTLPPISKRKSTHKHGEVCIYE